VHEACEGIRGRLDFFVEADYTPGGGLFALMKEILVLMKKEATSHGNKSDHH
jgi:hypothetical protein